jgi:hypothetical protein
MKRSAPFLLLLLLTAACHKDQPPVSAEKMIPLLADIHLAEAASNMIHPDSGRIQGEKNLDSLAQWYRDILAHHQMSREEFVKAMAWYKAHPGTLDTLYGHVIANLNEPVK